MQHEEARVGVLPSQHCQEGHHGHQDMDGGPYRGGKGGERLRR